MEEKASEEMEEKKEEQAPSAPLVPDAGANRKWYVIRVQTGREDDVKEAIEKLKAAKNMQVQIGDVVIPSEKVTELKHGKRSTRDRKLYQGYVFVSMEMSNDTWFAIRETPGVGDFLGLKDPIPLQEHEVQKLVHQAETTEEKPRVHMSFAKSDLVRVKEGPFENFEGTVEEINERKGMVKVSMIIFGRPTNVELEYWQLEKI